MKATSIAGFFLILFAIAIFPYHMFQRKVEPAALPPANATNMFCRHSAWVDVNATSTLSQYSMYHNAYASVVLLYFNGGKLPENCVWQYTSFVPGRA